MPPPPPGCSWVGDCSLSLGDGEWSCGDGDCKRGCDSGDCSGGPGDWSCPGVWGAGEWSWGPAAGAAASSAPCLATLWPLGVGGSWAVASVSEAPLDI